MTEDELVLNAQRAEDTVEEDASGMTRVEAAFYQRAHALVELRPLHCEKVHKMPMSGLHPSMLLGFVCRDEGEWVDLRRRRALVRFLCFVFLLRVVLTALRSYRGRSLRSRTSR
jgi:hypothetical protein